MLLGTLADSLVGNVLAGKGVKANIHGRGVIQAGEGTIRSEQDI